MASSGGFLLTFDFELLWGFVHRGSPDRSLLKKLGRTRDLLPKVLELLDEFGVHTTWGVVWALSFQGFRDLEAFVASKAPELLPRFVRLARQLASEEAVLFFPEFVTRLKATEHEIASHSFSHLSWSCASRDHFLSELRLAMFRARELELRPESVIFAENDYEPEALVAAHAAGLRVYRARADFGLRGRAFPPLLQRGLRLVHTVIPRPAGFPVAFPISPLAAVPEARFLRMGGPAVWSRLQRSTIQRELERAAAEGGSYQLWLHPHNLAAAGGLEELRLVLELYAELRGRYGFENPTLAGFGFRRKDEAEGN